MDKKQAREMIQDIFSSAFDRERYTLFLSNLLNNVESRDGHYTGNLVPEAYRDHVNQYWRIGKYTDPGGDELDLLVVEVKTLTKLERARTALRNFAINRLKKFEKEASLIAFYAKDDSGADWRFSFVKIEHEATKDEKGKVKLKQQLTPARRYSFLVGEHENSHTAQAQLVDLLAMDYANPTVEEIEKAFSIEKVTKEFFEQYKDLFVHLSEVLADQPYFQQEPDPEKRKQIVAKFAKKLLGQIVFLYFLQKKGWMGIKKDDEWGKGERRFLQTLFAAADKARQNYYVEKLQFLFYEALANDRKDQFDPSYYQRFDCRIPFLNGGLFEADYDWQKIRVEIPNPVFSNNEKGKSGDTGTGILDVFDRYNFTIREDEPLDKEIAVDPEMLGKVFENMLEITERKSKGAFYTPREIVHYMCQESLIHYLNGEVGEDTTSAIPKPDIETLVRKGIFAIENDQDALATKERIKQGEIKSTKKDTILPQTILANAELIDDKLADIKICDPAIGSGAFPVGMLHEIVNARLALARHLPEVRRLRQYDLKKHTIAHSIYGVDLDPSAIDIARLRLWLSLVVDEDDYTSIDALPNLDYKIMQGNSLIEEYEGVKLFNAAFIEDEPDNAEQIQNLKQEESDISREYIALSQQEKLSKEQKKAFDQRLRTIKGQIKALQSPAQQENDAELFDFLSEARKKAELLEELHQKFFDVSSPAEKRQLRDEITMLEWALIEATLVEQNKTDALAKLEEYKTSGEKPWFLWKLNFSEVFRQKGGFDIVIGNPPYNELRDLDSVTQNACKKTRLYKYAKGGRLNLFQFFYPLAFDIVKYRGIFSLITQNSILGEDTAVQNRHLLFCESLPLEIVSFPERDDVRRRVFESAKMSVAVGMFRKDVPSLERAFSLTVCNDREMNIEHSSEITVASVKELFPKTLIIPLCHPSLRSILLKMISMKNVFFLNSLAGEIDMTKYRSHFNTIGEGVRVLTGAQVLRYRLTDTPSQGDVLYLRKTKLKLSPLKLAHGKIPRVVMQRITGVDSCRRLIMTSVPSGVLCANSTNYIPSSCHGLDYAMGILNSTLVNHYFKMTSTNTNVTTSEINRIPIPIPDQLAERGVSSLVGKLKVLYSCDNSDAHLVISFLEQLIDALVYELYFPEEIKAAGKEILLHLGELTPIADAMSDEEKRAVIQREFDRLYDPNHPVRNHLETLDSVEVVRTIRESLKR